MARAAALRLRAALEEYVSSNKGDHPRGHARGTEADLVKQAEALLTGMTPASDGAGDTPGRRAAGISDSGRATDSASQRAREMLGAQGAAADGGEQ